MILIRFVLIVLFVNYVKGGLISNERDENVKRVIRDAYKYNYPPSAEYISVPVSVLYEEGNRADKSINAKVTTSDDLQNSQKESAGPEVTTLKLDEDILEVTTEIHEEKSTESTTVITTERETDEDSVVISLQTITKSELNSKSRDHNQNTKTVFRPQEGLIIPVAVVYDVVPENIQRRSKSGIKAINRQQRNKNTATENEVHEETKNKISSNDKRSGDVIVSSRTFPKRTQEPNPIIPIVQSENYVFSDSGNFHYSYEGGDGTKAFERGELRSGRAGEAVEGSFSYTGKDGKDYSLTYTAGENGYRPVGAHLPTPPPIPPAIARALKYLATKPTPESITESYN